MSFTPAGVFVPATSANLGPGFDCLGLALGFGLRARVSPSKRTTVRVSGEGGERLARDERNLVYRAMRRTAGVAGIDLPPLTLEVRSEIPLARGLGSSSAAIVAGVMLGNAIAGGHFSTAELLRIAWQIEGHPDNVAPALIGGCVACVVEGEDLHYLGLPVPGSLEAVLLIPEFEMPTAAARAVMPAAYSRADCVFNASRTALLVGALAAGRLDLLRVATQDRLHQPARTQVFPALPEIIAAALDAGAKAAFLSGAGSTVCALASERTEAIGQAMLTASLARGVEGRSRVAPLSAAGATLEAAMEQV